MEWTSETIAVQREAVKKSYNLKVDKYKEKYEKYIYPNQKEDAQNIVHIFTENPDCRAVSIVKKTKVGMDGLMIEVLYSMTCVVPDEFILNKDNIRIITGMSNKKWEEDMDNKIPAIFKKKVVFHHGQLGKANLNGLRNGLIIIDEIDTGNKAKQKLSKILKDNNLFNFHYIKANNIRFIFTSATMLGELHELHRWGDDIHTFHRMIIPPSYIGHKEFLDRNIIRKFYPLEKLEHANRWVKEDIIDNYGDDYRIHIVRGRDKELNYVRNACAANNVDFKLFTSDTNETDIDNLEDLLEDIEIYNRHIVVGIKGLLRRANLIPNSLKLKIGATHELYTKKVDNNVQIQGLSGRMSGYWRDEIESGHKTGPYRTSIESVKQYEKKYEDPFGEGNYQSNTCIKKGTHTNIKTTMLSTLENIELRDYPSNKTITTDISTCRIYDNFAVVDEVCKKLKYKRGESKTITKNNQKFYICLNNNESKADIANMNKLLGNIRVCWGDRKNTVGKKVITTGYPCYIDTDNVDTFRYVLLIRRTTSKKLLEETDREYPPLKHNYKSVPETYSEHSWSAL